MKKMTIALLTAAAMGGSSLAIAADVTGPTLFGRLDVRVTDRDTNTDSDGEFSAAEDLEISSASQHIGVSGSATGLAGGLEASYYTRYGTGSNSLEYGFVSVGGPFGTIQYGVDDEILYKFAGVYVDVPRVGATAAFAGQNAAGFADNPSVQYTNDFGGSPVTLGIQVDNGEGGSDSASTDNGIENTQVGLSVNAGIADFGVVYAEQDTADTDVLYAGGALDAGVATFTAYAGSNEDDEDTYTIGANVPLNEVLTGYLYYGDNDADADTTAELRANLGGGLDAYVGTRQGDSNDTLYIGSRWGF